MILMKMLPGVLKELVKHVPTVLFKVVDWTELAHEFPKISRRILQKEGYPELLGQQQKLLAPFQVRLKEGPSTSDGKLDQVNGERLLHLYFAQLFSPQGLFLDLRPQHFSYGSDELSWHPTGFWTQFSEKFRSGLLEVYEGFYLEDEQKYKRGLAAIGLLNEAWSEEDKRQLSELFKAQFGSALSSPMAFELDHFREAILKMSEFMLQKEVNISKDFLYLGIYLVTLYAHLEEGQLRYPVRDIYLHVRRCFQEAGEPR